MWIYTAYTLLKFFSPFRIFEQLALALKNRVSLKFFTVLNIFCHSRFLSNYALALKTEFALKFFTVLNIPFVMQGFWATCACPEKQFPWIHCIEYIFFIIQDFWATCACPENRVALKFFKVLKYLSSFRIFEQLACACPESRVSLKNFTVLIYFLSFRTFEQLALALKTELPWNSLLYGKWPDNCSLWNFQKHLESWGTTST